MMPLERMLKVIAVGVALNPRDTLSAIGRRLKPKGRANPQVLRLRAMTREAPLLLRIETVNVCNAACAFCSYPGMKRKKGVMSMALFEKIVKDYEEMGGGPVSLTPVQGDALLDPHLLERIRMLEGRPLINQITLTTNAIALERYSDDDVRYLLSTLYCLQLSVGGLDAETYRTMYAVDRFAKVERAMERIVRLKEGLPGHAAIAFAFRTNDWKFEIRFRRRLKEFRREGIFISHIWLFDNYSGLVTSDKGRNLVVVDRLPKQEDACIYPSVNMAVLSDGRVTACGCTDIEGSGLLIGDAGKEPLAAVWSGKKRRAMLDSFEKGKPPLMCQRCTAYQPDSNFSLSYFRDIVPHRPLSRNFYHLFWGA